jgi:hypothetical protein
VYSGGTTTEARLKTNVGASVVVRGKLVDFTHGREIWPASATVCR